MEREFGKYTFNVKMPVDGVVIKRIDRYQRGMGADAIAFSPQTVVIFEDHRTKEIGMVNLPGFSSQHPYFGFEYVKKSIVNQLRPNFPITEGEVFLESPSITPDGGYKFGVELNMALMTMPGVSEDGIIISRDVLHKFRFKTYERRVVEFGRDAFPLNIYGTADNYKAFPDIGEYVKEDGLLMVKRKYDPDLAIVGMNVFDTMEPDFTFDEPCYAPAGKGRIVDVRIHHDHMNTQGLTPFGIDAQAAKYDRARKQFYEEIYREWKSLHRRHGATLRLKPDFHALVKEAISVVGESKERIHKHYRRAPLDDYRIEFVIEYEVTPIDGFKLTDCHGGKGVICKICEPWQMPVDAHGNRADIVMDPNSTVSRMNMGRLYEQYINACARDVRRTIGMQLGIDLEDKARIFRRLTEVDATNPQLIDQSWDYLMGYYKIVSPRTYNWFMSGEYRKTRIDHLEKILKHFIYTYLPTENEPEPEQMIAELEQYYPPLFSSVTYVGNSGRRVITKLPVRIGSMYILLLEKIADDWTAVSSGKTQHFGVLSQVTNSNKYTGPIRTQAVRAVGEAEVRIYVSYAGERVTAEILDRNNNPTTHRYMVQQLLVAPKPTNITNLVDRNIIPLGQSRPLQMVKHIIQCGGSKFVYKSMLH
jgi:DNA-directed RNA polymerase beta subunit